MKVYLYELDSVRNTAAEIQIAQERLFEETVWNGKTVVLSANQLLDGMGFTGALYGKKGEKNYETLISLFRSGLVKVCRFTESWERNGKTIESLAEYLLLNMNREKFITSGVQIDQEGKSCMEEALAGDKPYILDKWVEGKTGETEKTKAEYVRRVTNLIYELGLYDIWVDEDVNSAKIAFYPLINLFLHPETMSLEAEKEYKELREAIPKIQDARNLLYSIDGMIESGEKNRRSSWRDLLEPSKCQSTDVVGITIARRIIDLCYNISIESGIAGVTLPYERKEGAIQAAQYSFLLEQLKSFVDSRSFTVLTQEEKKTRKSIKKPCAKKMKLPPWESALEIIEEVEATKTFSTHSLRDEKSTERETRKNWRISFGCALLKRIMHLAVCVVILIAVNFAINYISDKMIGRIEINGWATLIISACITWAVNRVLANKWLKKYTDGENDLVEVIFKMFTLIWRTVKVVNYVITIKLTRWIASSFSEQKGR